MRPQNLLGLAGSISVLRVSEPPAWDCQSLFTFGDSYTSTGFDVASTQPSLDNPMGNPELGQGTSADSINWVGYLTTTYNDTPILSYNFAVYDATVDNDLVPSIPQDFVNQVSVSFEPNYCQTSTQSVAGQGWGPESALFVIWFGINEFVSLSPQSSSLNYARVRERTNKPGTSVHGSFSDPSPPEKVACVLERYFAQIDRIYGCGARSFVAINVPQMHRSPKLLSYNARTRRRYEKVVLEFNQQLEIAVLQWSQDHDDSSITIYDAWTFTGGVLDNPRKYGFVDSTCMGEEGCVWWNSFHPRSAFHDLLAQDIARFLRTQ
ncbi:hypothetical protein BJX64DRAFT_291076 [Aspergillus heterothallicus]